MGATKRYLEQRLTELGLDEELTEENLQKIHDADTAKAELLEGDR